MGMFPFEFKTSIKISFSDRFFARDMVNASNPTQRILFGRGTLWLQHSIKF